MFWLLCLLCFIPVAVYFWIIKPLRFWRDLGVVHKRPWPAFIQVISGPFKKQSVADILKGTFGLFPERRYYGIYELTTPVLVVRDPELLKQITIGDFDHFTDHTGLIPPDSITQRGLFTLKGEEWRRMRTILSPSFTSSKIKSMFALVLDCAEQFTRHFQKRTAQDRITVEMTEMITRFANDVIASVVFGSKVDSLEDPDNEFYLMGQAFTRFSFLRYAFFYCFKKPLGFLKQQFFPEVPLTFLRGLVKETLRRRETEGFVRSDMIQLLIEARKREDGLAGKHHQLALSDDYITSHAMGFFIAGFSTVAQALFMLVYELALNPDVQERLRDEIDQALKHCDEKITYDGLMGMKYLDMVVSEGLRKWPAPTPLNRVCVKDYTIAPKLADEKPLRLKKGQLMKFSPIGFQRDPELYPNPEKFDPERFNDVNKREINPSSYVPFGIGPRICIASRYALMEMKIFVFNLLAKMVVEPVAKTPVPVAFVRKGFGMAVDGGLWLGLRPRS